MGKLLLGIDVGTSSCKAAVFDLDGAVVAQASRPWDVLYPAPGYAEQDPGEWWRGVCGAVSEAMSRGGIAGKQIAGVGIDGQSWSAIPVDRRGRVLHNTPIWQDTRSASIARDVAGRVGFDRIFAVSGNPMSPAYSTAKMLWFKQFQPDVFKNTFAFLQSNSYIAFKLTGRFTQDKSQGYGVHAFDMRRGCWDEEMCGELGLEREKLPEIFACHDVIGEVTGEAAAATGLRPGTPVVAGGLDACCSALGAGAFRAGQAQEQGGTAGGMNLCVDGARAHPKLILSFHVVPGVWLLQGGTAGGGGCLKWFRQELGFYESECERLGQGGAFDIMSGEAERVAPGSDGLIFLPYMAGERSPIWDEHAKGVFFGLDYGKTRAHMIRAVMEGCAYALEHNMRVALEAGVDPDALNAMGGAANSLVWTQIKADVTGKPFRVPASDTAATLGAAILAGVGTGQYRDFAEAVGRTVRFVRAHEPDMGRHALYMEYFDIYIELYEKLKRTMEALDRVGGR